MAVVQPAFCCIQSPVNIPKNYLRQSASPICTMDDEHMRIAWGQWDLILVLFLERKGHVRSNDKPTVSKIPKPVALWATALMLDSLEDDRLYLLHEAKEAAASAV